MYFEAFMLIQPIFDLSSFVRGVVVQAQMQRDILRHGAVDLFQEFDEFLGPMARAKHSPIAMPDLTSRAANSVVVPLRL